MLETPSPSPASLPSTPVPPNDGRNDEGEGTAATPIPTSSPPAPSTLAPPTPASPTPTDLEPLTPAPPTPVALVVQTPAPLNATESDMQADEVESGATKLLGLSVSFLIALLFVAFSH